MQATLTGAFPWLCHRLSGRLDAWGAAGYSHGGLTVTPQGQAALEAGLDLQMAAAGVRGTLLDDGGDALTLTGTTDALAVRTSSGRATSGGGGGADAGALAATSAAVTRLRLGLEASWPVRVFGATLTPSVEAGVRHDGGDAEAGFGLDLGGGLALSEPGLGVRAEVRGRGLLSHESDGFRERGFSGALGWRQRPDSDRRASLALTGTVGGAAAGGAQALLSRATLAGLASGGPGAADDLQARRLEAKFDYGLAAFGGRFTLTPEAGAGFSDTGRDQRLGLRLAPAGGAESFELALEAARREAADVATPPEHEVGFRLNARFLNLTPGGGIAFATRARSRHCLP